MVNYTFYTDQGWKVTEYRPFSASYAVLHTPCFDSYRQANHGKASYAESASGVNHQEDLLGSLTKRQITFESYSADVLRQLLAERVSIRDRNRSAILGRLGDVSGEIQGASLPYAPDGHKRKQALEKTRMELERDLRETDERLWKDTAEIREKLIAANRKVDGSYFRSGLFTHNDQYKGSRFAGLPD